MDGKILCALDFFEDVTRVKEKEVQKLFKFIEGLFRELSTPVIDTN
ncbi:hypothetical protein [Archaeoglobus sulfaticallidus]|nr:hypothetical protein [Archaeoglobus sulfaticallidus]